MANHFALGMDLVRGSLLAAALLGAAVCGSSGDGGGGGYSTGLPRDKQLKDLSDGEIQTACRNASKASASAFGDAEYRGMCAAQLGAMNPEGCTEAAIDQCVASAKAQNKPDENACDDVSSDREKVAGCTATVGEWEDCMTQMSAAYSKAYRELSCTNTEEPDVPKTADCEALDRKCPEVMDD